MKNIQRETRKMFALGRVACISRTKMQVMVFGLITALIFSSCPSMLMITEAAYENDSVYWNEEYIDDSEETIETIIQNTENEQGTVEAPESISQNTENEQETEEAPESKSQNTENGQGTEEASESISQNTENGQDTEEASETISQNTENGQGTEEASETISQNTENGQVMEEASETISQNTENGQGTEEAPETISQNNESSETSSDNFYEAEEYKNYGVVPSEPFYEYSQKAIDQLNGVGDTGDEILLLASSLPSYYSSVSVGLVTAVKNQGEDGTCWAHAMCAALESNIIKNKIGNDTKNNIDLSESHLVNTVFYRKGINDPLGNTLGDYMVKLNNNLGCNCTIAKNSLLNWADPAMEKDYPYSSISESLVPENYYDAEFHVQQSLEYDDNSSRTVSGRGILKNEILKYGAVDVSYHSNGKFISGNSIYVPEALTINHTVTIVGWDDNYDRHNFNSYSLAEVTKENCKYKELVDRENHYYAYVNTKVRPVKNGAWLIKNSWGEKAGEEGYFWISYEDKSLSSFFSFQCEQPDNYDHNFHYDGGFSGKISYVEKGTSAANVYTNTLEDAQIISAVGIGVYSTDMQFEVQIYKNPETGKVSSNMPLLAEPLVCKTTQAGYYTFPLPEDSLARVEPGVRFSIVFTAKTEGYIDIDKTVSSNYYSFYTKQVANSCFSNNKSYTKGTFRIKAYTNNAEKVNMNGFSLDIVSGEHGSVTYHKKQINGKTALSMTFLPDDHYTVEKILLDGKEIALTDSYEIKELTKNRKIEVTFKYDIRKVVVKQKFDITEYFSEIKEPIVKYKVENIDTGRASVTTKGILTAKKAGTVKVIPVVKIGKNKVELWDQAVEIPLIAPVFDKTKMYATYIGQEVSGNSYFTLNDEYQNVVFSTKILKNPIIELDSATGDITVLKTGTVSIKAEITNEQGRIVKYTQSFKVYKPKMNYVETTIKIGKSKTISLLNLPKTETANFKWYGGVINGEGKLGDYASFKYFDKYPNKIKVTGKAEGDIYLRAYIQGQKYTCVIHIKE